MGMLDSGSGAQGVQTATGARARCADVRYERGYEYPTSGSCLSAKARTGIRLFFEVDGSSVCASLLDERTHVLHSELQEYLVGNCAQRSCSHCFGIQRCLQLGLFSKTKNRTFQSKSHTITK
jgi:hypothetical protein